MPHATVCFVLLRLCTHVYHCLKSIFAHIKCCTSTEIRLLRIIFYQFAVPITLLTQSHWHLLLKCWRKINIKMNRILTHSHIKNANFGLFPWMPILGCFLLYVNIYIDAVTVNGKFASKNSWHLTFNTLYVHIYVLIHSIVYLLYTLYVHQQIIIIQYVE